MSLSTEQLNSSEGKVMIPGTYNLVLGTGATSSGTFTPGSTEWDGYVTLSQGTSSSASGLWYGLSTWDDLGEPRSYISFTPTIPLSATYGAACSVEASFGQSGSGEVALYAVTAGYENPRLVAWVGSGSTNPEGYQTSGWIHPGNEDVVFIDAHADAAAALTNATELRLVLRNSVPTSGVTLSKWYVYEPITEAPTGIVDQWTSNVNAINYTISATGAAGYSNRAGLVQFGSLALTGWTPVPASNISPVTSILTGDSRTYIIYGLPTGLLIGDTLKIYDSYGNYTYVSGSQNARTTLSGAITSVVDGNTVSLSAIAYTSTATGLSALFTTQVTWREWYGSRYGTLHTVSTSSLTGDPMSTTYTYDTTFDLTGCYNGVAYITAKRYEPIIGDYAYFQYFDTKKAYSDPIGPNIYAANAYSRPGHVLFSFAASDIGNIETHQISMGGTTYDKVTYSPQPTTAYVTSACTGTLGEVITGSIVFEDDTVNSTTSDVVSAVVGAGTFGEQTAPPYNLPHLDILLCEDLNIVLRWDSWDRYTSGALGFRIPIQYFNIYRKTSQENEYTLIDTATKTARTYLDNTLITVGVYDYVVEGVDDLFRTYYLAGTAYVLDNPNPDWIPFIEPYLALFPVWTAAPAKTHTTKKLLG